SWRSARAKPAQQLASHASQAEQRIEWRERCREFQHPPFAYSGSEYQSQQVACLVGPALPGSHEKPMAGEAESAAAFRPHPLRHRSGQRRDGSVAGEPSADSVGKLSPQKLMAQLQRNQQEPQRARSLGASQGTLPIQARLVTDELREVAGPAKTLPQMF